MPFQNPVAFLKVGAPAVISGTILISYHHFFSFSYLLGADNVLGMFVLALLWFIFTLSLLMAIVGCHRIFILGKDYVKDRKYIHWTGNELEYGAWWILFIVLAAILYLPFALISFSIDEAVIEQENMLNTIIGYPAIIPIYYIISRWSLVLPSCAIGIGQQTPAWSWRLSRGNGWRLTLLVSLPPIITELILDLFPDSFSTLNLLLIGATWLLLGIIEIGLLSRSYSFLVGEREDNSHVAV